LSMITTSPATTPMDIARRADRCKRNTYGPP
jgi:hypothetical protein